MNYSTKIQRVIFRSLFFTVAFAGIATALQAQVKQEGSESQFKMVAHGESVSPSTLLPASPEPINLEIAPKAPDFGGLKKAGSGLELDSPVNVPATASTGANRLKHNSATFTHFDLPFAARVFLLAAFSALTIRQRRPV